MLYNFKLKTLKKKLHSRRKYIILKLKYAVINYLDKKYKITILQKSHLTLTKI